VDVTAGVDVVELSVVDGEASLVTPAKGVVDVVSAVPEHATDDTETNTNTNHRGFIVGFQGLSVSSRRTVSLVSSCMRCDE
jgi:hypothetical protein